MFSGRFVMDFTTNMVAVLSRSINEGASPACDVCVSSLPSESKVDGREL